MTVVRRSRRPKVEDPLPAPHLDSDKKREVYALVAAAREEGITNAEMEKGYRSPLSGVTSNFHKEGRIAALRKRRDGGRVYLLPEYVHGRETVDQGRAGGAEYERGLTDGAERVLDLVHQLEPEVYGRIAEAAHDDGLVT